MPRFKVKVYRTASIMSRTCETVVMSFDTDTFEDAAFLATSLAERDKSAPWENDVEAPEFPPTSIQRAVHVGEITNEDNVVVSTGANPYAALLAPSILRPLPTDGQGSFSDERGGSGRPQAIFPSQVPHGPSTVVGPGTPRMGTEIVEPPAHVRGSKASLPPYDPDAERRAASVADLLTMDATGQRSEPAIIPPGQLAIGMEPADPKELQNDAPGAHGRPIPLYETWRPQGPDHMLDAGQRAEIVRATREAYDRDYPGEREKQERLAGGTRN